MKARPKFTPAWLWRVRHARWRREKFPGDYKPSSNIKWFTDLLAKASGQ